MKRFLLLVLLSAIAMLASASAHALCEHDRYEYYNGYLPPIDDGEQPFLIFEIDCSKSGRIIAEVYNEPLKLTDRFDRALVYRDYRGRIWQIELEDARVGKIGYGRLKLLVKRDDKVMLRHRLASNTLFDVSNPECASAHGDGGFWTGQLSLEFPLSKSADLAELAISRGWQAWNWQKSQKTTGNELFFSPNICEDSECQLMMDVGPGVELAAMTAINAISPGICATWVAGAAGGAPIQVAGIALATFTNPETPSPAQTATLIDEKVLSNIFSGKVTRTDLRVIGRGHRFGFSLVGPAEAMGTGLARDYWYKADLAVDVGISVSNSDVSESIMITIVDLFEIRAPESIDHLPDALIRSGRQMDYFDSKTGELGHDGQLMQGWLEELATRFASIAGGEVVGVY